MQSEWVLKAISIFTAQLSGKQSSALTVLVCCRYPERDAILVSGGTFALARFFDQLL